MNLPNRMALPHRFTIRHLGLVALALLSQIVAYWGYVVPFFSGMGFPSPFAPSAFWLLLIATGCIATGTVLLSCYFDDNPSATTRRGIRLHRRTTIVAHHSLNLIASLIALYVAILADHILLGLLFPLAAGAIWFYFTLYKYQLWSGTLLVVGAAIALPGVVLLHTVSFANALIWQKIALESISILPLVHQLGAYAILMACMALLLHWVQGIVWFISIQQLGRNTLATSMGLRKARLFTAAAYLGLLGLTRLLQEYLPAVGLQVWGSAISILICIVVPLVISLLMLLTAEKLAHYRIALSTLWAAAAGLVVHPLMAHAIRLYC